MTQKRSPSVSSRSFEHLDHSLTFVLDYNPSGGETYNQGYSGQADSYNAGGASGAGYYDGGQQHQQQ